MLNIKKYTIKSNYAKQLRLIFFILKKRHKNATKTPQKRHKNYKTPQKRHKNATKTPQKSPNNS